MLDDVYKDINELIELLQKYLIALKNIRYLAKSAHLDIEYWKKKYDEIADWDNKTNTG